MSRENFFCCIGKFAGITNSRFTPGGIKINEFNLAVKTKVPWKEPYYSNLLIKSCSELADKIELVKTGEIISVEGIIEAVGSNASKVTCLLATKIIKEKENE